MAGTTRNRCEAETVQKGVNGDYEIPFAYTLKLQKIIYEKHSF